MYEISQAVPAQASPAGYPMLRQARHLPDLFERAAESFKEASGAAYVLLYLTVSEEEAIELSFAGSPPPRRPEVLWRGSRDPQKAPWHRLGASEILLIEHRHRPFALVVLGPPSRCASEPQSLRSLCDATREVLEQTLLETRAQAADFQEQRANRHHHQAKTLGQRLRQVSHDLRNHLVPMLYATEELQEILSAPDALRLLINLERQIRLADQLSKQSLLPLCRPGPSRRTDLAAAAREMAEGWQSAFEKRRLTFTLQLPDHAVWVDGDPSQHHQVIGNLLSNAHKYTAPGGRIRLALTVQSDGCLLEVSDSGRGIAPLVRRRLFEAPVREDPSIEGHGLGLTHVHSILEGLGGSIAVTTRPGHGSSFQVRLRTHAKPLPTP